MTDHAERDADGRTIEISHPGKVLFPDDGITKQDLVDHYLAVAPVMLPHTRRRPVAMRRFPDGIGEDGFFEKKVPAHFPDWVHRIEVSTEDGHQEHVACDDAATLAFLAGQACIETHVWLSRDDDLAHPDQLILDLDPSVEDLRTLHRAVRAAGELCEELGLTSYLKTTGSRGYHVQVPLDRSATFETVRGVARAMADTLADRDPEHVTTQQRKERRGDRIFVDYLRNAHGQNAIPPYAVRARPGAPVATPLEWEELGTAVPDGCTIRTIGRRLAQKEDPWRNIASDRHSLVEASRRLERLREG